ncbi:MAG: hypothetical protein AAF662_04280 [Pseudomonadota bacterium]
MVKDNPKPLSVEALDDTELVSFGRVFLETWMKNGFGGLSKKDTELLIFACLENALARDRTVNNYEWATTLKVTTSKVKSLRLESHMRYADLFGKRRALIHADRFLKNIESLTIEVNADDPSLKGRVRFLAEDPVIKMEVEVAIKAMGGLVHYERNREVIALDVVHFLTLTAMAYGTGEEDIVADIAHKLQSNDRKRKAAQKELRGAEYKQLTEGEKLHKGLRTMAESVLGKKLALFDHLDEIVSSQKYHGTFQIGN